MVVQRKWMYLESIFIGGDIRAQLPEEAKKFDDIDKTFKKVCSMLRFCVAREGVCAKELVIGGRRGGWWQRARVLVQTFGYISFINNQSSI